MRLLTIALISLLASNAAFGASVVIKNYSDWDIYNLYLSPTSSNDWGPDQLDNDVITSGSSYKLKGISCDTYDVRLIDEDNDVCILSDVALCIFKETWEIDNDLLLSCQGQTQVSNTQATGGTMTLYNASQWNIRELYISPSQQSNWGEDVLGSDIWGSGGTVDVWNLDCGEYDMRMVDEVDDVCQIDNIYLCGNEGTVTLTDEILLGCQGY